MSFHIRNGKMVFSSKYKFRTIPRNEVVKLQNNRSSGVALRISREWKITTK